MSFVNVNWVPVKALGLVFAVQQISLWK